MNKTTGKQIILAYSGGLDTSVILKWLVNKGYIVTAFVADVGQEEDFAAVKAKALQIGATHVVVENYQEEFVNDYIFTALKSGALYEGRYLLGTSLARPLIARKIVEYAQKFGINHIAHGATGKGNDQIRFELVFMQFLPDVTVIAPWKDPEFLSEFTGRTDLLNYAASNNIPVTSTLQKPYSIDENLMHCSYEAGILEDPQLTPPANMFKKTVSPQDAPNITQHLEIEFKHGVPVKIINLTTKTTIDSSSLAIFNYLNKIGGENGIGRIDMVESRFVGMKSRGVYETPGGTILMNAHQDLEALTVGKDLLHTKNTLAVRWAQMAYFGFWYCEEMEAMQAFLTSSQRHVTGRVHLE